MIGGLFVFGVVIGIVGAATGRPFDGRFSEQTNILIVRERKDNE